MRDLSLPHFLFFRFILLSFLDGSLSYLTCRDWSYEGSPIRIPPPIPFNLFVFFFSFFKCISESFDSFDSQNLVNELPAVGGTNPYPLAPTMTPLVSAVLGGGPAGNNTGPTKRKPYALNVFSQSSRRSCDRSHDCSLWYQKCKLYFTSAFSVQWIRLRS